MQEPGVLNPPTPDENPWLKYAGHLKDEPLLEDWRAAIEEYRAKRDSDVDPPNA